MKGLGEGGQAQEDGRREEKKDKNRNARGVRR